MAHPTGQWFIATAGNQWWFDSGATALDFAYTGGMGDNPHWERLSKPDDLAAWLAERFPGADGEVTQRDLVDATGLRSAIARSFTGVARGEAVTAHDVDVINLFAATPDIPPVLDGGTRQAGRSRLRTSQALSAMARETITLLAGDPARIRECAADDCALVFYDESRAASRRWCSMQRCGNRAKVRAHRARVGR